MAIVSLKPDSPPAIQTTIPETISEPSNSIFTSLVPESKILSLLKYVEGYPWSVNYYGQILNIENTLEHFDPTTPNLTQPYYKVIKLILQVDSPLSSSYDATTGITTITGTAIAPYKIKPNVGDVFIAQVDSGEDAIFHITSVSRKTHRKDTLYEVAYSLYSYTSVNPDFVTTLESRVNDSYYFNNDTNFFNRDVLIKPSVKEAIDRNRLFLKESQDYYFRTFAQKQTGSIVIPGINDTIYDPLLLDFLSKTVSYDRLAETPFHRYTYISSEITQPSIYDALLNRSVALIHNVNKRQGFIPTHLLPNRARLGTAFHAGVDYILYPIDHNLITSDKTPFDRSLFINTVKTSINTNSYSDAVIETTNNDAVYMKSLLHELFIDDYYLVSKAFYDYLNDNTKYDDISYIELLLAKFIKKEAINREDIAVAVQSWNQWSPLNQLYILPICWMLAEFYS